MPVSQAVRSGGVFIVLLFVSVLFLPLTSFSASAGAGIKPAIPEELQPWVPWVLHDQEEKTCTLDAAGSGRRFCSWPTRLELNVTGHGASFNQEWVVEVGGLVALPGNIPYWPENVRANEKKLVVTSRNGRPVVWLDPGKYRLSGTYTWQKLPDHLFVPPETGLVRLILQGKEIKNLQLDEHGQLWFKQIKKPVKENENSLTVQVFRRIDDAVPLQQQLHILLVVSGSPREVTLGLETGGDFVPLRLKSPLPVRLDKQGRMQLQVRPGQWQISLTLRNTAARSPEKISRGSIDGIWPEQEIWVFHGNPRLRQIQVQGLAPVDPARTSLPDDWKNLPAYLIKSGEEMRLHEKYRGDPDPTPNRLNFKRKIWLDENGSGLTVLDTITGTMSRGWRLNVAPSQSLGKVEVEGRNRLITRLTGSEKTGVEVRQGSLSLHAESRIEQPVRSGRLVMPALGWEHPAEQLSAVLNLPPGWKLLTASGVDKVATWFNQWTLLDIFLVLIVAIASARILGWGWGGIALCTLILLYHQPGSPRFLWLPLLGLLGLQKIIPAKKGERIFRISALILLAAIILGAIPFMVNEVRVGLYPQLEYGRSYPVVSEQHRDMVQADETVTVNAVVERSMAPKSRKVAGSALYSMQSAPAAPQPIRVDPQAMIQTGPGLPDWSWNQIRLTWNGPVRPEQQISFILLSPLVNTILALIRVLLLALLIFGFFRHCLRAGGQMNLPGLTGKTALLLPLVLLGALTALPGRVSAEVPRADILQELQSRLLAPPDCGTSCAAVNRCLIQVAKETLQVELEVDVLAREAVPLPGKNRFFEQILLDGQPVEAMRLDSQGNSLLRLEPGAHRLLLTRDLKGKNKLSFSFPLLPARGQAVLDGWTISGLRENGKLDTQISLNRIKPAADEHGEESGKVQLPAFVQVVRTLHMGLKWSLETRVVRVTPDTAVALDIPLLPGERVISEGLYVKENSVRVNMEPAQSLFSWHSAMDPVDGLTLSAPETTSWTEQWLLDISPIWHVETTGVPALNQTNSSGRRFPEFRPYPGESLHLAVSRPAGVPGPVMTVTSSSLKIKPGQRATENTLTFSFTASRGMRHRIILPPDIELQNVLLDKKKYPLQLEENSLVLPVKPGKQEVEISWRSERGVGLKLVSEPVDLGVQSVNASTVMQVPSNRWILLTGGPRIGPAVLFWGELLVIILIAFVLGRIRLTPLTTLQWLLLSLGLSQIPVPFAAIVVFWLLLLGLRKEKAGKLAGAAGFNLVQIVLVLLTFAALASLFAAIQQGLLGHPDMQIGGNGSSGHLLRWYQDRSDSLLPTVWVITVPLLVYRLSMLLWALWLAVSLLRWLGWGWECFSDTAIWKKSRSRSSEKKQKRTLFSRSRSRPKSEPAAVSPDQAESRDAKKKNQTCRKPGDQKYGS